MPAVYLLWLDAIDRPLVYEMLSEGRLPALRKLMESGCFGETRSVEHSLPETTQHILLTGCTSEMTHYWSQVKYSPDSYGLSSCRPYDFERYPEFFALGPEYKVCMFDLPQSVLSERIHGLQVVGWGANSPMYPPGSSPAHFYGELVEKYGQHVGAHIHQGSADVESHEDITSFFDSLIADLERRVKVTRDLIARDQWDLFITGISEVHMGTHYFWKHPHARVLEGRDLARELYEAADRALEAILAAIPATARIFAFTVEGMEENSMDLASGVLLPELMYRYSFPGKTTRDFEYDESALSARQAERARLITSGWKRPSLAARILRKFLPMQTAVAIEQALGIDYTLVSPRNFPELGYQPAARFSPVWRYMKAFALTTFSDGYIRVNLKGREKNGLVEPADYSGVLDEIIGLVRELRDLDTGDSVVEKIIRTREDPLAPDDHLPDADLIILWRSNSARGWVSPKFGRLGPFRCLRTGAHHPEGFFIAKGPGIRTGGRLAGERNVLNLFPTFLEAGGLSVPDYLPGESMFDELQEPAGRASGVPAL